ncbi:RNA polymerase sigma factor [Spirosoma aerolatum]|uniref:RNA polymerase sigma factor n=1 Tax=Spirosoma aerolatum TaxID=1211326 RepID=UPI0009AE9AEF|nr:RNA polymerase sigma factor [Spirosoma aerolatum]
MKQSIAIHKSQLPVSSNDAFDNLYKKYVKKVFQKCLSVTNDVEAAEDCTQDIFLKAFTHLKAFRNQSRLSTWLYSIAHNYCQDRIRLEKRLATERMTPGMDVRSDETNAQESVDEQILQLENLLQQLPNEEATLLRLKYEQNLSIQQLSRRFHLSESAIKMRLKRSREKLRALAVACDEWND